MVNDIRNDISMEGKIPSLPLGEIPEFTKRDKPRRRLKGNRVRSIPRKMFMKKAPLAPIRIVASRSRNMSSAGSPYSQSLSRLSNRTVMY